jgi:hypothetical protein
MIPLDYVLAAALLAAPPGPGPCPGPLPGARPGAVQGPAEEKVGEGLYPLAPTLAVLAQHAEVMDRRENYLLSDPDEFVSDVCLLRRRMRLLADAPPLHDWRRFPERGVVSEFLEFNRAYLRHLEQRLAIEGTRRDELAEAIEETEQLYRIWDAVRDAGSECYYVTVRRTALLHLLQALGPDDYYGGKLPPHVPLWRFSRSD